MKNLITLLMLLTSFKSAAYMDEDIYTYCVNGTIEQCRDYERLGLAKSVYVFCDTVSSPDTCIEEVARCNESIKACQDKHFYKYE